MNVLEQYIKEIHSEKIMTKNGFTFIEVDVTSDCYGCVERKKRLFGLNEWEVAKKNGYWMG